MKKILILCGHYADGRFSNSICVKNIAEAFVQSGCSVKVVAWGDEIKVVPISLNGVEITYVKEPQFQKVVEYFSTKGTFYRILFKILYVIRYFLVLPFYPNNSPTTSRKFFIEAERLIKEYGINTVLATYTPYDGIWAGIKLKKKYGDIISFVTYHLDLMSSPDNTGLVRTYKIWKNRRAFKKELKYADKILLPESAEVEEHPKIRIVGFPLFTCAPTKSTSTFVFPTDSINLTYIGSLSTENRDPSMAIKTLEEVNKETKQRLVFHIWGFVGDKRCMDIINASPYVEYHGVVNNDEVGLLLLRSDFLVNISNKTTYKMIPSKIFQYFATGRPVIDFVNNKEDVSVEFFEKYQGALIVNEYNTDAANASKLVLSFVDVFKGERIGSVEEVFKNYIPETICKTIID